MTMQPLTAAHQLTALQATTVISLFTMPIYGMALVAGRRRLTEPRLRDAVPDTKWRDRVFSRILRAVRRSPSAHVILSRIVKLEKRYGWVLTFLPYLAVGFIGTVLAQYYAARIPLASGVAIGTLGPIAVTMWFASHRRLKGLALFLPLLTAAGAMMFIPWGHHLDGAGVLAAVAGAVVAAVGVFTGKSVSNSGILLKTR
ncbi:hypothetical protein [Actinoallomurus sp. NPDC052274]|uniref:hypothetical protein n=1 Tax=Actinoallomurus sp. NPDC052274 TaxID=3155420 RepID=UPI00341C23FF